MDGFRERLGGRYDRSDRGDRSDRSERAGGRSDRGDRYDRASEERYSDDRYDRSSRRSEGVSIDAISDAVDKSNRDQLGVIADMFDDARADRLESEKAIIDALSNKLSQGGGSVREVAPAPVATQPAVDSEALGRIESLIGRNAESIIEGRAVSERNAASLRVNTELLNELKAGIAEVLKTQGVQTDADSASDEKEEILGALSDNRTLLNMLRQEIVNGFANAGANEEETPEGALTAEVIDKYYKDMEEHVHKECVKCYRNVQSALTEQNAEFEKKVTKSLSGINIFNIVSVVLNVVTIVLLVCSILGIL